MDKRSCGAASQPLLALLLLAALLGCCSAGSCRAANLCCQGRDSGCVIQKASPNAIIESPRDKPCYCDHACLRLGDCCDDFNETCTVSDCLVGEWSEWSGCDNRCGSGWRSRHRPILRPERNAGKACPETRQTAACQNFDACRRRAHHFRVQETSYSTSRSAAEASLDSNFVPRVTRGYCAVFTILKISRGCRRKLESFHEGSRVCVWCREDEELGTEPPPPVPSTCQLYRRSPSLAGIGHWEMSNSSAGARCHGQWISELEAPARSSCDNSVCRGKPSLAFL